MTFGREIDETTSHQILDRFAEAGGNFIDTADVYTRGASEEVGKTPAQVALNWLLQRSGVTAPIIGVRRLEHLEDNLGATGWALDDGHKRQLDQVSELPLPRYPHEFVARAQRE